MRGRRWEGCCISWVSIPSYSPQPFPAQEAKQAKSSPPLFSDGEFDLDCGVTDIRLYGDDHITPNTKQVEHITKRLKSAPGLILSVGLTRAYASSPDFSPVHWLQVNNIHLQDDPLWQLG
jgi:hypothetical protein